VFVHRRQHVLVEVGGDRGAGVPEPLGHDLERLAGRQRRGRVAVADAVQGDRRQAGVAHQAGEPLGDVLRVEDLAVLAGEDQAGFDPRRSPS
jgi:hypothetical protein